MINLKQLPSPEKRLFLKAILLLILILLFTLSATIPFLFESQSLWYKFGINKSLLRTGKIAGLFAAILLFLQIILAIRTPFLDKIFGLDRVYFLHRINGILIAVMATLHVSLVIIPEGIDNLPIGVKFWPEMVGAAMFIILICVTLSAYSRPILMPYHQWRLFHRPMGYFLFCGTSVHILFVSESFEKVVPKTALFTLIGLVLIGILITKYLNRLQAKRKWQVVEAIPLNDRVVSILLKPSSSFYYAPGQFIFLTFGSTDVPREPHPFTVASSPADGENLRVIINKSGKWTRKIETASRGKAILSGPFGLFSYHAKAKTQQLIFIAAGIGITPMLSMLNHIAADAKQPKVTLIWSIRHKSDMFLQKEMTELKKGITSFEVFLIYTQHNSNARLNREGLNKLLTSHNKNDSHVYICGPTQMIKETRISLLHLGFSRKNIFWENFSF